MRAKVEAVFIGSVENSFKDSDGNLVEYRQISVNVPGEMDSCIVSVPRDLDISGLEQYKPCYLVIDFRYNSQYRNFKARLAAVYPTAKALQDADANIDGYVDSSSYNSSSKKSDKPF